MFNVELRQGFALRFRASKTDLIPKLVFLLTVPSGSSFAVLLCGSVVTYVAFVLSLLFPHLSFFRCLGKAVLRDYSISLVSSVIVLFQC